MDYSEWLMGFACGAGFMFVCGVMCIVAIWPDLKRYRRMQG